MLTFCETASFQENDAKITWFFPPGGACYSKGRRGKITDGMEEEIMATAIKETPVLKGEAAPHFLKTIWENERKKVPKEDYERAKNAYRNFKVVC